MSPAQRVVADDRVHRALARMADQVLANAICPHYVAGVPWADVRWRRGSRYFGTEGALRKAAWRVLRRHTDASRDPAARSPSRAAARAAEGRQLVRGRRPEGTVINMVNPNELHPDAAVDHGRSPDIVDNAQAAANTPANGDPYERFAQQQKAEREAQHAALPSNEQKRLAITKELMSGQLSEKERVAQIQERRQLLVSAEDDSEKRAFANSGLDGARELYGLTAPQAHVLPQAYLEEYEADFSGHEEGLPRLVPHERARLPRGVRAARRRLPPGALPRRAARARRGAGPDRHEARPHHEAGRRAEELVAEERGRWWYRVRVTRTLADVSEQKQQGLAKSRRPVNALVRVDGDVSRAIKVLKEQMIDDGTHARRRGGSRLWEYQKPSVRARAKSKKARTRLAKAERLRAAHERACRSPWPRPSCAACATPAEEGGGDRRRRELIHHLAAAGVVRYAPHS